MSGGVDSAVALLRAAPNAIGVTLRLWLDPGRPRRRARVLLARGGDRRARDVPSARPPARDARPARGVPARGRRAVRARLRARRDAEPVHPLQRRLPLRASCSRSRSAPAATGSRRATTRASPSIAAGCCSHRAADAQKDQSYMLARLDPGAARPHLVPARRAGQGRRRAARPSARASPSRAAPRARRRASSPATTTARSSARHGLAPRAGRDRRRARGASSASTTASGGSRRGSARASASRRRSRSTCSTPTRAANAVVVGPRESLARTRVAASGPPLRRRRPRRREAPLPLAGGRRAACRARPGGFELELDEPAYGVARGQAAVLYEGDAVVGCGVVSSGRRRLRSVADARRRVHVGGPLAARARRLPRSPSGSPSRTCSCAWAEPLGAFPRSSRERSARSSR